MNDASAGVNGPPAADAPTLTEPCSPPGTDEACWYKFAAKSADNHSGPAGSGPCGGSGRVMPVTPLAWPAAHGAGARRCNWPGWYRDFQTSPLLSRTGLARKPRANICAGARLRNEQLAAGFAPHGEPNVGGR